MVVKVSEPVKLNAREASDIAKLVMKKVVIVLEPKKFNTKKDKLKEAEREIRREKALEEELKNEEEEKNVDLFEDEEIKDDIFLDSENDKDAGIFLDDNNVNLYNVEVESNDNETGLPDKIFIDNGFEEVEEKKPIDLFNQTDPFLDDNEFERKENEIREDIMGDMPKIDNIGTVKPNNMLNQIENVTNENKDIILPTMGLSTNSNVEVPIVSENYIN